MNDLLDYGPDGLTLVTARERIRVLEAGAAHPLSNPNLIARIGMLEAALRALEPLVEFALGEQSPPYHDQALWDAALKALGSSAETISLGGQNFIDQETFDRLQLEQGIRSGSVSETEPSGMEIAQREADEAAGDADPRDTVWGAAKSFSAWANDPRTVALMKRCENAEASTKERSSKTMNPTRELLDQANTELVAARRRTAQLEIMMLEIRNAETLTVAHMIAMAALGERWHKDSSTETEAKWVGPGVTYPCGCRSIGKLNEPPWYCREHNIAETMVKCKHCGLPSEMEFCSMGCALHHSQADRGAAK